MSYFKLCHFYRPTLLSQDNLMNVTVCLGLMMGKVSEASLCKLVKIDVFLQETSRIKRIIAKIINVSYATARRIYTKLKLEVELKSQRMGCCDQKKKKSAKMTKNQENYWIELQDTSKKTENHYGRPRYQHFF